MVNGDATENGEEPRKCDVIVITGKRDLCEMAKKALMVRYRTRHAACTNMSCFLQTPHAVYTVVE